MAEIDGIDVVEEGNTKTSSKQQSQRLQWAFTFNNYEKHHLDGLHALFKEICSDWIFQEEKGENGTPHLQGAIRLKKSMRYTEFSPDKKIHWEGQKSLNSSNYCSKLKSRIGEIRYGGSYKPKNIVKTIETLREWQLKIKELCATEPDDRKIYWFWDEKGNIGKSAFIKYMVVNYNALLCQGGKHSDIINLVFNCDMERTNIMFFDIPRANKGNVSYSSLECIKNGMVCNTKYETGVKVFNPPHLIIFANFPPSEYDMLSEDRWVIEELM